MRHKYTLFRRKNTKVWYFYYYEGKKRISKSTGKIKKYEAEQYIEKQLQNISSSQLTLKEYAKDFFVWNRCPHGRRLRDEMRTLTKRHVHNQRLWLEKYVFTDPVAGQIISEIKRAHIIDFRSRLIDNGVGPNTVNKVDETLKIIFKEAVFRGEIDRDPTFGIGKVKYVRKEAGIFTRDELGRFFP